MGYTAVMPTRAARILAVGHFLWSAILLLAALWSTYAVSTALTHTISGTPKSQLLAALYLITLYTAPIAALSAWLFILGRRLWTGTPTRTALLITHSILLALALLAILIGLAAIHQANQSIARGGGIMSPLAWAPLIFGAFM